LRLRLGGADAGTVQQRGEERAMGRDAALVGAARRRRGDKGAGDAAGAGAAVRGTTGIASVKRGDYNRETRSQKQMTVAMSMKKDQAAILEELCEFRFPERTDARIQRLMDRNNEGLLTPEERDELEAYVEINQKLSLLRGEALLALGRSPQ